MVAKATSRCLAMDLAAASIMPASLASHSPAMRAMFTFGSILIVLAIVALSMRHQLQADKRFLPSPAASGTLSGTPANQVSQYQHEVEAAMKAAAQHTADQAASAGEDGTR